MKTLCTLVLMYICLGSFAQPIQLKGTVKNGNRAERNQCRDLPPADFQHGLPHPGNLAE